MPLLEVTEPHARPPRLLAAVRPGRQWSGSLELDRGWTELAGVEVSSDQHVDLAGCEQLSITDSLVEGLVLAGGVVGGAGPAVEIRQSHLTGCDLSGARIEALRAAKLEGCKLSGTDLSGVGLTDVVFERCSFRYANLRMAKLSRVAFLDCALDEVDLYDVEATDVSVDGSALSAVNIDRLRATRVDLRGATELGLAAVGRLDGCLVADHQLPALALTLALALGVDLERPEADDDGEVGA